MKGHVDHMNAIMSSITVHDVAHILWIVDGLTLLAFLYYMIVLLRSRRERQDSYTEWLDAATKKLEGRPSASELWSAFQPIYAAGSRRTSSNWAATQITLMKSLRELSDPELASIDALSARAVKSINDFGKMIDDGLFTPRDVVRENAALHRDLLIECQIIEPYIWFKWVFLARGRWGLRIPQLAEALIRLRSNSTVPLLWRETSLSFPSENGIDAYTFCDELKSFTRFRHRTVNIFRPCTIDRQSKLRITKKRKILSKRTKYSTTLPGSLW
jgi:hypothetical protein